MSVVQKITKMTHPEIFLSYAWGGEGWLQDFAYRINISWWIFALAGLLSLVIALVVIGFQTVRSAIANPAGSLRAE
jgi:putative ABC transport system permease protein